MEEVNRETRETIGRNDSRTRQELIPMSETLKNSLSDQKLAVDKCRESCGGPQKCRTGGLVEYMENGITSRVFCPVMEKYLRQIKIQQKIMNALPKNFWDRSFENFISRTPDLKAANTAKKFSEKKAWKIGANLVFLGGYGTGKTHLAAAIVSDAISRGSTAAFVTSTSLTGSIQEISARFEDLKTIELVAIDDVAVEQENKIVMQKMFELINYRYEAELGTVMTSNLNPKEFKDLMGERIWDRLAERVFIVYIQDAESFRKQKRDEYVDWLREE